ncbi:MAG: hypothetical protein SFY92_06235 [Verrucomicrobiae bacterium]|nr:hypothetical protein [Verrucomicrobiae bacterium]
MSPLESRLHDALTDLFDRLESKADPAECLACFDRIDGVRREWGPQMPPQLAHYLDRRSYEKALAFLKNPSLPHQA